MFASGNQLKYAAVMFAVGYLCAFIVDLRYGFFYVFGRKTLAKTSLAFYFVEAAALFYITFDGLKIPVLRLYMPLLFVTGGAAYVKSFHKVLAIIYNYCYNISNTIIRRLHERRDHGRTKVKKGGRGKRSHSRGSAFRVVDVYGLPDGGDRRKKARNRRA